MGKNILCVAMGVKSDIKAVGIALANASSLVTLSNDMFKSNANGNVYNLEITFADLPLLVLGARSVF